MRCGLAFAQAAGKKGKRFAMPSTRIMMHQPAGGAMGSADEVNIQASELNRTMKVRARHSLNQQSSLWHAEGAAGALPPTLICEHVA